MSNKPREYTREEVQDLFIKRCLVMANYWENESRVKTVKEKMEGLLHSIFVIIDGGSCNIPGFLISPNPHESDKNYHIEHDENYFPESKAENDCDIGGDMHDRFHQIKAELNQT